MKKGVFITFEGGDGAGKSTQIEILAKHLQDAGIEITLSREPGGTAIGEQLRAITLDPKNVGVTPETEAYLMAAARAHHVQEVIKPALEARKVVVCDRYVDSSIAYQGYGRILGPEKIAKLNELAVNGAVPDLTIFLNVPPEIGLSRRVKSHKVKDRLDLEQQDFYKRVHEGYLEIARKEPKRVKIIDATKTIETVAGEVWQIVKRELSDHK